MRDYVIDDVTGVLTPPRDALGMARRIADLLADDARRASSGSAAASAVRGSFTLDHMWDAIGRVMAGLVDLDQRRARPPRGGRGAADSRQGAVAPRLPQQLPARSV